MEMLIFCLAIALIILLFSNNNKKEELLRIRAITDCEGRAIDNPRIFRNILYNGGSNSWYTKKTDDELKVIIYDFFRNIKYESFPEENLLEEAISNFQSAEYFFNEYQESLKKNEKKKCQEQYSNYLIMNERFNALDIDKLSTLIYYETEEHWN